MERVSSGEGQQAVWDSSYERRDNYLFYPNEEVIRFSAKYVRKRTGANEFITRLTGRDVIRVLDLGCGIGRHVVFFHDLQCEAYGADLSEVAVREARERLRARGVRDADARIMQADARVLPWQDGFFHCAVSHGVLDSMPFEVALESIKEVKRVLEPGGLFYFDVVAADGMQVADGFEGEVVVQGAHERGTIQSYFTKAKVERMLGDSFEIREMYLVDRQPIVASSPVRRIHVVGARIN